MGAIVANGEHWEVVEGVHKRKKTKDRSKSKDESSGHRESRREKRRSEQEADARHANGQASGGRPAIPAEMTSREEPRDREHRRRSTNESSRRRSREMPNGDGRGASQGGYDPSAPASGAGLERRTSTSTRPTSELPTAADLNALKAREAWEMERLFRGRSFYHHPEQQEIMQMPSPEPMQPNGYHQMAMYATPQGGYPAVHGSSHTSYTMQAPFQGGQQQPVHSSAFYAIPPPVIYQSPYSSQEYVGQGRSVSPRDSYPDPGSLDVIPSEVGSPPPRTNPLPAPPRQSSYKSPTLSPTRAEPSSPELSPQYWKSYAGLAAH
jgi:hypothetical protein